MNAEPAASRARDVALQRRAHLGMEGRRPGARRVAAERVRWAIRVPARRRRRPHPHRAARAGGGPHRRHLGAHVSRGGARLDRPAGSPDPAASVGLAHLVRPGRGPRRPAHRRRPSAAHARHRARAQRRSLDTGARRPADIDGRRTGGRSTADLLRRRPVETTTAIVDRFVDALVRQSLDDAGWWPDLGRRRDPRSRARHAFDPSARRQPGHRPNRQRPRPARVRRRDRPPRRRVAPCRAARRGDSRSWWPASDSSPRPIRSTTGSSSCSWPTRSIPAGGARPPTCGTRPRSPSTSPVVAPTGSTCSATPSRPGAEAAGDALPGPVAVVPRPHADEHGARHRRRRVVPRRGSRCPRTARHRTHRSRAVDSSRRSCSRHRPRR